MGQHGHHLSRDGKDLYHLPAVTHDTVPEHFDQHGMCPALAVATDSVQHRQADSDDTGSTCIPYDASGAMYNTNDSSLMLAKQPCHLQIAESKEVLAQTEQLRENHLKGSSFSHSGIPLICLQL